MKIVPMMSAANTAQSSPASIAPTPRRLTMTTNASPDRFAPAAAPAPESVIPDTGVQANAAPEATQPLSPQLAAIARQRRALQVKEREIADREKALSTQPAPGAPGWIDPALLKSDPLRVMRDAGVTYDQLTQAILTSSGSQEVNDLKTQLEALKGDVDKRFTDHASQQEQQALAEMRREAETLAKTGDTYELVRETGSLPQVMDLIERTFRQSGEILDVPEAMQLVEDHLITESLKLAATAKVRTRLAPPPPPAQPQKPQPQLAMRTLTNRDGASVQQSRRARAMAAFHGSLQR